MQGLLYEKNLRVYPSSTAEFSQGEIINFIQNDSATAYGLLMWFPYFLGQPLVIVVCLYLIFQALGPSFFACAGVFAVGGIITTLIANQIIVYRKRHLDK